MDDTVFVEVTGTVLTQHSLIDNLRSISRGQQAFLKALITTGKELDSTADGSTLVPRKVIQAYLKDQGQGSSDAMMSKRLKELVELGIASLEKHYQTGKKRVNHYLVEDLAKLASLPSRKPEGAPKPRRTTKAIVRKQKELFLDDEANSILLQDPKNITIHFHERVFNGILDSAMRLSHKDTRKEIQVKCQIGGAPLRITANCSSAEDSGIAVLTDQRAMRSIISYCKKEIARRKVKLIAQHGESGFNETMVPNVFNLDIHDLCVLMGMTCANKNLDQIVGMMRRLADTNFRVDATENQWFRDNFSMLPGGGELPQSDTFEFRFLQNFEIAHENTKIADLFGEQDITQLRPRFYTFSLEMRMFYSLLYDGTTNLFLSHEELAIERSGIIQRFYNWARAFVSGRRKGNLNQRWYTIHDMYDHLTPAARFDNFRAYFMRALQKFSVDDNWVQGEEGVALVYGYYVHYKRIDGEDSFRFERDPEDQIVGDNSRHNVQLRQQAFEDLSHAG